MFRKPSTVSGAPKLETKYESKYKLKTEPKFEDTYKQYLKESHKIEPKLEDTAATSSTSKRLGRPVPQRPGKQTQKTNMCSCASVLSFRQDCQNTFRSKLDPVLTNNCCQSKVKTTQETNRQIQFV